MAGARHCATGGRAPDDRERWIPWRPGVNAAHAADAVEIGYGVLPEHRRQGYATEAAEALIALARTQGIDHFVASVSPDNEPSLAIIRKLGFVRTGEHIDPEDGLEHVFELQG